MDVVGVGVVEVLQDGQRFVPNRLRLGVLAECGVGVAYV